MGWCRWEAQERVGLRGSGEVRIVHGIYGSLALRAADEEGEAVLVRTWRSMLAAYQALVLAEDRPGLRIVVESLYFDLPD